MLKRLGLAFAGLFAFVHLAAAAGTIPLSLTQQFDNTTHLPLSGGKLFFIQAGTTSTPQNAYQDSALTIPHPNPLTLDSGARIPQLFFADGQIKIRLTNASGVTQLSVDNIQVIGASSGSGGGGTVDATTILATGDIKARYGTGALSGFIRLNGRTIGSATSGATERANADTQVLFEYLWTADTTLTVSTGRGASANADWVANKTIELPDARGRALAGLNDMGNTNSGVLAPLAYTKGSTIILGSLMGYGASRTLLTGNLPPYTPSGTITNGAIANDAVKNGGSLGSGPSSPGAQPAGGPNATITQAASTFTGTAQGGTSTAFDTISPLMVITLYMKL